MRLFHPPHPNPPEGGGEGADDVAGFSNHKALNRFHFFPSPPMGERVGVRGKESSRTKQCFSKFMNFWATYNEQPSLQKPNRTLLPKSPFYKGGLESVVLIPPFEKGGQGGFSSLASGKYLPFPFSLRPHRRDTGATTR